MLSYIQPFIYPRFHQKHVVPLFLPCILLSLKTNITINIYTNESSNYNIMLVEKKNIISYGVASDTMTVNVTHVYNRLHWRVYYQRRIGLHVDPSFSGTADSTTRVLSGFRSSVPTQNYNNTNFIFHENM